MASLLVANVSIILCGLVVYFFALVVYRLFLCPIARFPGPKLAAASFWYEGYYDIVKGGQYVFKIKEMHQKYGPIVRISPQELHIDDPDFYGNIYSRDGKWDKWYYYTDQFGTRESEIFTIDHELHHLRRASVNPYFSKAKVNSLEPLIRKYIEKLCSRLERARGLDRTIPLRLAYECLTTDIITDYLMFTCYNTLDDPSWNKKYHDMVHGIGAVTHLTKQIPIINPIIQALPPSFLVKLDPGMALWIEFQQQCETEARKVLAALSSSSSSNKKSSTPQPTQQNVFYSILSNPTLPVTEKSPWRMRWEGAQFVSAGTDTVSNTMHQISWHVYSNPSILAALRAELSTVGPNPPLKALEPLPYLTGCIYEGLRLGHGLSGRSARVAPDRKIQYQDWDIPKGTPVSLTSVDVHMNERIFPEAERFVPERWVDPKERVRLERYLVAFTKGTRNCLGINLAWAELYLITALIFTRFDFSFVETTYEDHVKFAADMYFPHSKKDTGDMKVLVR